MAVVTISKQYGCAAEEIAKRVCSLLGYQYFDKRNILLMAAEAGLSDKDLFDITVDDLEKRDLMRKVVTKTVYIPVMGRKIPDPDSSSMGASFNDGQPFDFGEKMNREHALTMTQTILRHAVKLGNMVISGRGGQALFRDTPGVFHFRITAPLDKRIDYVMETEGLDPSESRRMVKKHDAAAADYLRKTYKIDWEDPNLYHMIINAGRVHYDEAARIIADFVKA